MFMVLVVILVFVLVVILEIGVFLYIFVVFFGVVIYFGLGSKIDESIVFVILLWFVGLLFGYVLEVIGNKIVCFMVL